MRVLAVAESLNRVESKEKFLIKPGGLSHISCDMAVVEGCVGVGFCRELQACLAEGVAVCCNLLNNACIVRRVAHHGDIVEVFGCAAEHGGAAYVDVLNGIGHCDTLFCDGGFKRIQVHTNELDGLYAVFG